MAKTVKHHKDGGSTITVRLDAETDGILANLLDQMAEMDTLGRMPTTSDVVRLGIRRLYAELVEEPGSQSDLADRLSLGPKEERDGR